MISGVLKLTNICLDYEYSIWFSTLVIIIILNFKIVLRSKTEFCNNSTIYHFIGESNVVWTHNDETNKESVVFAGDIKIRKDLRIKLIDGTSLYIKEATRAYAGNTLYFSNQGNIIYSGNYKISTFQKGWWLKWFLNSFPGKYRCEVEWSNDKKPLQIIHTLKVLVAPTVRFIPSTLGSSSSIGYIKTGKLHCLALVPYCAFWFSIIKSRAPNW